MLLAQNPSQIDVLTTDQGLLFREVIAITQDTNGLMWFGSPQGIMRYDGYQFKSYNSIKENPFFIEEEQITGEFVLDDTGPLLWYMANDRLFKLNMTTDNVLEYGLDENVKGNVLRLLKTFDGSIWIVTDDYWTTQNGNSKQYLQKYVNGDFQVMATTPRNNRGFSSLVLDVDGYIWWSTTNANLKYDQQGNLVASYDLGSYDWFDSELHFVVSFFDTKNIHYYFPHERGGINVFNEPNQNSRRLLDISEEFNQAIEDHQNYIWFAGNQVLYRMSPEGAFENYTELLKSQFDYSSINSLFIDANNLLWVATDNGLFKIKVGEQLFTTVFKSNKEGWGNAMRGIFEDGQGTIYALCENRNEIFYKTKAGKLDTLKLDWDDTKPSTLQYAANFFVLDEDQENVYTAAVSLLKINLQTGKVKGFEKFKSNLKVYGPNPIIKLKDGRLLFGYTFSRLVLFNPITEESEFVFKNFGSFPEITNIRFFKESIKDNKIWIGTQNDGLFKVTLDGRIEKQYQIDTQPSINKNYVLVLEENTDGSLWVGTYGGGLNYISADGTTTKGYTTSQGLPDNNIVGILPDDKNNLWISTYNGLSYFDVQSKIFQNFYAEDGLSNNEFNYSSFFKDSHGNYYFGGMNGITTFEPGKVLKKSEPPELKFLGVSGYNSKLKGSYEIDLVQTPLTGLDISPYDQYFQINWNMPSYFHNQKNTFTTKLEGYENRWFFQGFNSSIRYNQLPAGHYVLKIKGTDSRGNETRDILSIPIKVRQIFYKKWWFITLVLLIIVGIMYSIFRYRFQQTLAMERLRTKISSDLHDDVGSLLSGLAMQTELMEINATDADKFKLQKIADISRNAISQMRDLVWSIDSRRETIKDLIERMHELAEELLLSKSISFQIDSAGVKHPNRKLLAQTKQNIFMIYKEAVTNIIRHSDATHVDIRIINKFKGCDIVIKDNGGTKKYYKSTGFGLANMTMRAEKLNASINFDKHKGFGVYLHLPFHL